MSLPALLGGVPIATPDTYPSWPQWGDREREELLATLASGAWWTGDGERAYRFAREFARYQGAAAGYPFTNGTQTLEAALVACGVGEGDEVIVPAMTFVASASAVLAVNATPVIVDVDGDTLCIDVEAAAAAIGERTRAIIAVHVAGAVCDLDLLVPLCERNALHLIEDCAHAHGSQWRGRGAGSYGSFGSFSMQQGKLMTAGEGGALIGNDQSLLDAAWNYADCGRERGRWFYHHATIGSNFRMTEWQGAVLLGQLERFPEQHAVRNANAIALGEALAQIPGLRAQKRDGRMDSQGNYCFVVHFDSDEFAGMPLRRFEQALCAEGIPLGVSYPSLSDLEVFRRGNFAPTRRSSAPALDYATLHLPVAEHAAASTVWMEHRLLLADREHVLLVAEAAARLHEHAAAIMQTSPIGAGA
jgi:dTDP-4-amino-4,6-dideoxygalactose transaminase